MHFIPFENSMKSLLKNYFATNTHTRNTHTQHTLEEENGERGGCTANAYRIEVLVTFSYRNIAHNTMSNLIKMLRRVECNTC